MNDNEKSNDNFYPNRSFFLSNKNLLSTSNNLSCLFLFFFSVYGDPHFLVSIQGLSVPVCFHILGKKGDILNLLSDTKKGNTFTDFI